MAFDFATFLDHFGGREAAQGISAATQAPTTAELADDSADRAEMVGGDQADGPDIEPQWETARPLVDETHLVALVEVVRAVLLDHAPTPAVSTVIKVPVPAGQSVQVVPAGGGRRRTVNLANSGVVTLFVSPDRREDETGYRVPGSTDDAQLTTSTDGPIFAFCPSGGSDGELSAWIDYHDAPTG